MYELSKPLDDSPFSKQLNVMKRKRIIAGNYNPVAHNTVFTLLCGSQCCVIPQYASSSVSEIDGVST